MSDVLSFFQINVDLFSFKWKKKIKEIMKDKKEKNLFNVLIDTVSGVNTR